MDIVTFYKKAREIGGIAIVQGNHVQVDLYVEYYDEGHGYYNIPRHKGASALDLARAVALVESTGAEKVTIYSGHNSTCLFVRGELPVDRSEDAD